MDNLEIREEYRRFLQLARGLSAYRENNYSQVEPAADTKKLNSMLEVVHLQNGIMVLYTEN